MSNDSERLHLLTKFIKQKDDKTGKMLFTYKPYLARFLKLFFPMFESMTVDEIIEQSIDGGEKKAGALVNQLSGEQNLLDEPQLREDFVACLRLPDYMQNEDQEKFFILHIEIQGKATDLDLARRESEYFTTLYGYFNMAPYKNEDERAKNLIPIVSVWIILDPNKKDIGIIDDRNYSSRKSVSNESMRVEHSYFAEKTTSTLKSYRIYLDTNLDEEKKTAPNIQGFLYGSFESKTPEELEEFLKLYQLNESEEFKKEVNNMNALMQSNYNQGYDQGRSDMFDDMFDDMVLGMLEENEGKMSHQEAENKVNNWLKKAQEARKRSQREPKQL